MHRIRVCLVVFVFVLSAMVAGVGGARDSDLARIKTIAIVSAMGHQLELANVGVTVFGNRRGMTDVADFVRLFADGDAQGAVGSLNGQFCLAKGPPRG